MPSEIDPGKEIQKNEESLPVVLNEEDYAYGDEIAPSTQLPQFKLCQNATREKPEGVNPGDFYNSATGKNYGKEFVMHVFTSKIGRVKFTPEYKLECKANDGIEGNTYGKCTECSFSKWKDDREERKTKYCSPVVNFLMIPEGEVIPGFLGLSKVREKAGHKINSQLNFLKAENKLISLEKRVPIYFYKVKLTSVETTYGAEKIFDVRISMAGIEKNEDQKRVLIELFRQWKTFQHEVAEEKEEPKEAKNF